MLFIVNHTCPTLLVYSGFSPGNKAGLCRLSSNCSISEHAPITRLMVWGVDLVPNVHKLLLASSFRTGSGVSGAVSRKGHPDQNDKSDSLVELMS